MTGGVIRCERHGRVPFGAGFRCPGCEAERPRDMPCVLYCWACNDMVRGTRREAFTVKACERCGDGAYEYDVL